jgi:hypothetical protein
MALRVRVHSPHEVGDGLAASRQESSEHQDEESVIRWGGESRLKHTQYWHRKVWDLHILSLSWWSRPCQRSSHTSAP